MAGVAGARGTSRATGERAESRQLVPGGNNRDNLPAQPNQSSTSPQKGKIKNAMTSEGRKASTLLMDEKRISLLNSNIQSLNYFINQNFLERLSACDVVPMIGDTEDHSSISAFEISRLMLNPKESTYEKLVSLYAALGKSPATVAIIIQSDGISTHLYICAKSNGDEDRVKATSQLLKDGFLAQFPGSQLSRLSPDKADQLMDSLVGQPRDQYVRSVSIMPSRREEEKQNNGFELSAQGLEKFIDSMSRKDRNSKVGKRYTAVFLAQPVQQTEIEACKMGYEQLYTLLSPFAKESVSYSENESDATNYSMSVNMSKSISKSISNSYGTSHTYGTSSGQSGESGFFSSGSMWNSGTSTSEGTSSSTAESQSTNVTDGSSDTEGTTKTAGKSKTITLNREIKTVQTCMKRLDAEIQRIEDNRCFGLWNCCCYVISDTLETATMASSSLQALMTGDADYGSNSYNNFWIGKSDELDVKNILLYLSNMQHPLLKLPNPANSDVGEQIVSPTMMVSGRDLPTLLSLPARSVQGLQVLTMAEFGRNFPKEFNPSGQKRIEFGNVIHMGEEESTQMVFNLDSFASHCFICGASGSGKSNTTYNLLNEFYKRHIPFLVIEPAKGEYKTEFGGMKDMQVFTAKPDGFRMLSLNPFEFHPAVHISEHLTNLLSVVQTCWPLFGAAPAMLKQAFEDAYVACGWDLELSERIVRIGHEFPTFADVLLAVDRIIDESDYGKESKGEYKGALTMRIQMLTNGFEGRIFGNPKGIPDVDLFDKNAVVDLSAIGSAETRSLIMGILIIKLREYRYATQTTANSGLKHITVLEEAHNILKRCSHETSQDSANVQGASVEMLVNCIAEMRSCGEGIMIIDQSPSAVDEAALKNTAVKIVMRLPEKNDCEAIGATLSLRDDQIPELSRLDVGTAAVFHVGWSETVLGRMGAIWKDTDEYAKFHINPKPIERNHVLRVKGAIVQWLSERVCEKNWDELSNMAGLRSFITKFRAANYAPSYNENLWTDTVMQLNQFINDLKISFGDLSELEDTADNSRTIKLMFGGFLRNFLQIDGLFKIYPLKIDNFKKERLSGQNKKETSPNNAEKQAPKSLTWWTNLGKKDISVINAWWSEFSLAASKYMLMPIQANAQRLNWPSNTMSSDYAITAIKSILISFAKQYTNEHIGDEAWKYQAAYHYLVKTVFKGRD